ncbi:acyl-CoA dehydrogenase [Steroidobacter denitrificans]|uniref:Acyl-[acyl-carrier-protein] dehydrogenase MbtN n=1 Tax=Steroidobacter denitrificans TaxID=465721 RepID=A0A127F8J2_STEDE|nr:acyl-CoA dehydrogenase family protein [Steroidobacter denitrificans]AMN46753.1 acyl-CoA dehydrogenase [Steroidobacter denitrificans]
MKNFPRDLFEPEHELIRQTARRFCEREIAPQHEMWEKAGVVPKAAWLKAGELGLLCMGMPQEYGGAALDFRASVVLLEELWRIGASGPGFALHSDIVAPYLLHHGSETTRRRWLPLMSRGEVVTAIAMTEPGTGSDLRAVSTSAVRDGDEYVIDGTKTFITNGLSAELVLVVARTVDAAGQSGLSLILVEADRPGFKRGRKLEKIGMKAQDTAELFFEKVRVPVDNLLGQEHRGLHHLMSELPQERLIIAVQAVSAARATLESTIEFTRNRQIFGKTTFDFQNTRFVLARALAELDVAQVFVDRCIALHVAGRLDATMAATAKLTATQMQNRLVDECLQLHGGYGYMWEYPVARAWADARAQRIYGGANEVMLELIARTL